MSPRRLALALALLASAAGGCVPVALPLLTLPAGLALTQNRTSLPPSPPKELMDSKLSDDASDYLHDHQLPHVEAQVVRSREGGTISAVVLTGQVATEFGKQDATRKVRDFLDDPAVEVRNQVEIMASPVFVPDRAYWEHIAAARASCKAGNRAECTRYQAIMDACLQQIGPSGTYVTRRACEGIPSAASNLGAGKGWMGVKVDTCPSGACVQYLMPKGPAEVAGIEVGDVIVGFNGRQIRTEDDFQGAIAGMYGWPDCHGRVAARRAQQKSRGESQEVSLLNAVTIYVCKKVRGPTSRQRGAPRQSAAPPRLAG